MGIVELFEIGIFTALWNWSNPILTILVYCCIAIGLLIQLVLLKKCRKSPKCWTLIGLCGVGIVASECAWQVITGWERLSIDIIYGMIICMMVGAGLAVAISLIHNTRK